MTRQWQRDRSRFNHDWLKNRYIPAVVKFIHTIDGKVIDHSFEGSFVNTLLPQWRQRRVEGIRLIAAFEEEMSPARLVDQPPLGYCPASTKQWLHKLVHGIWLVRYPAKELVKEAQTSLDSVDVSYEKLQAALLRVGNQDSPSRLGPLRPYVQEFQCACQQLANSIEGFAHELRMV